MSAPTTTALLHLVHSAKTRPLHRDEIRQLRAGIRALDTARSSTAGLRTALHHADRDRITLAAAVRGIDQLVHAWQTHPPRVATTSTAIDAIADLTRAALNAPEQP